jgi:hypothetical protein
LITPVAEVHKCYNFTKDASCKCHRPTRSSCNHEVDPVSPKDIEQAYRALGPAPEFWGHGTWVDRLNTFDRFIANGGIEANVLRTMKRILTTEDFQDYVALDPARYELLMAAFPVEHETYELHA